MNREYQRASTLGLAIHPGAWENNQTDLLVFMGIVLLLTDRWEQRFLYL